MRNDNIPDRVIDFGALIRFWPKWAQALLLCVFVWTWFSPAPTGVSQALLVEFLVFAALTVLNELLRPKPDNESQKPADLGDFTFPTTTEGRPVPLIWGTVLQKGPNVVWYGDLRQEAITERIKTGLWSRDTIVKGYRYHLGVQMGLCRGPNVELLRVFIGDDEVWSDGQSTDGHFDLDLPDFFGGDDLGSGGIQTTVDFYTGSTTQAVNGYLNDPGRQQIATAATPTCPRYTGTSYVVLRQMTSAAASASDRGAYIGNSTTVKPYSFELRRFPALFSGQTTGENKIGTYDANPINVIYEILTNKEWGFGLQSTDIDLTNFLAASDTMISEVNGFSMLVDRDMKARELMAELQRQIDGVVFLKPSTGKWTIKLARDDYDIDLVPQITDSEVKTIANFTRGAWEDTTNTITVEYAKRVDDYKLSYELAQDMANALIIGDGTISNAKSTVGSMRFPGVKTAALASNIAWRELRVQSYPLVRAKLTVNRKMWDVNLGDVVAWTNSYHSFVKLPMRVVSIDYGRLQDNKMVLTLVQDVFQFAAASMGSTPGTNWSPPSQATEAYASAAQLALEAPRTILLKDPEFAGDPQVSKVLCAAAFDANEVLFEIRQRNSSGTPSGSYVFAGNIVQFMKVGALNSSLAAGVASPTGTITIKPDFSTSTEMLAAFTSSATLQDLGVSLAHLIMVGTEFMLVSSASANGANVDLNNVYRGVLDSAQEAHAADDDVYLLFAGAGLTDTIFPNTNNVDVELRQQNSVETFEGAVTAISLTMDKRSIRPYPPAAVLYNSGGTAFNTPDLEDNGTGENGQQFALDWWRRRYNPDDELQAMLSDDTAVDASTEYQVRVWVDPDGINTEIASSPFAWQTGSGTIQVSRNEILDLVAASTKIRVEIQCRHDIYEEVDLTSRYSLRHDVTPTSVNDGLFYLGGNIGTGPSNAYVVASATAHTITIGATMTIGLAQYRINGGTWTTIIGTSATTAVLSVSDTIEVRVSAGTYAPDPNFVAIDDGTNRVAYGVL